MDIVIIQKLESLRRCIQRVQDRCPTEVGTLLADPDLQDIIVLNLTRAVQLCVDISSHIISHTSEAAPSTMGESFNILVKLDVLDEDTASDLRKTVGFRNIAIHSYEEVNWQIVHAICHKEIMSFQHFAKQISQYCEL